MTRKSLHMFIIDEKNSLFGYLLILSAEPAERENCLQKTENKAQWVVSSTPVED